MKKDKKILLASKSGASIEYIHEKPEAKKSLTTIPLK
jgi:hypothetical protein